jgi:hypothetical protein
MLQATTPVITFGSLLEQCQRQSVRVHELIKAVSEAEKVSTETVMHLEAVKGDLEILQASVFDSKLSSLSEVVELLTFSIDNFEAFLCWLDAGDEVIRELLLRMRAGLAEQV